MEPPLIKKKILTLLEHLQPPERQSIIQDISQLNQPEDHEDVLEELPPPDSLTSDQERFRKIVEYFPFPIVVIDENGIFTYINPTFSHDFGYTIEDLPDDKAWSLNVYPDIEYRKQILKEVNRPDHDHQAPMEREIVCKSGEVKTVIMQNKKIGNEEFTFFRDITARKTAEEKVSILQGMLPICSICKKIRSDQGYWESIEDYIREHSEAEFTHGICPECAKKEYGVDL
jgi:PAS domain S-box-containing protein